MIYPNSFLIFLNSFLLILIYILLRRTLLYPYKLSLSNRMIGEFFILLFLLFSFWGDWFHYNREIVMMYNNNGYGFEEVYNFIIHNFTFHYLFFRFIIWGGAFVILLKTAKRLKVNVDLVLLFLGCGWITLFAYARVTLAMAIMFLGYSYLCVPFRNLKVLSSIIGCLLICVSFFFHKSALFGIIIIISAFSIYKINSKVIIICILLLPLLIGFFKDNLMAFVLLGSNDYDPSLSQTIESGQRYMQKDVEEKGWGSLIRFFFEYTAFYVMAFVSMLYILSKKHNDNKQITILSTICLLMIGVASIFALDLGLNTQTIFIRFLRYSMIPCILLMAYFYSINYHRRLIKIVFISTICMSIYAILYTMYLNNAGVDLTKI